MTGRLRLIPAVVLTVGVVVSLVAGTSIERQNDHELDARLSADAQDLALLIQGIAGSVESSLSAVAGIALVTEGDTDAVARYLSATRTSGSHAVLDLTDDFEVLDVLDASTADAGDDDDLRSSRDEIDSLLADPTVREQIESVRASGGGFAMLSTQGTNALVLLSVASDATHTFADLQRYPLGPAGLFLTDQPGASNGFAVYTSPEPRADTAILASGTDLPLTGHTTTTHLDVGGQRLLIQVRGATDHGLPTVAATFLGIVSSVVVAAALWHATRQRDAAVDALQTARTADRRFRAALDASPDSVLFWHGATRTLSALNGDDFFGYPIDASADPVDLAEVLPDEDLAALEALCAAGATDTGTQLQIRRPDCSLAWAHVRLSPIAAADNAEKDDGLLVVITDITEVWTTERQRAQLEADLHQAQRMETIGQLAGGIAHDFNNLLAAISSTAELLLEDTTEPDAAQDLHEILAATHRGAALTKRLLTFSRRGVSTQDVVDVDLVVSGVGDLLRRMLDERIELAVEAIDRPLPVQGDSGEIEQILLNLVVNARDAAAGPGHLITVRTESRDGFARISVRDNGVGMSDEIRERAFEPFFTTKDADRGTGLGLSIVYGIASRMNGTVVIDSAPGTGTTIVVNLPLATSPAPTPAPVVAAAPTVERGERVLLVEDEPAVCRAAQRLLERAGHTVRTAKDGPDAIEVLEDTFGPTVLVTDVILPGPLTGRDIADRARALQPGIRVVYASGYPRDVITSDQLIEEHVAFVPKPFTSQALLAAVADREEVTQ